MTQLQIPKDQVEEKGLGDGEVGINNNKNNDDFVVSIQQATTTVKTVAMPSTPAMITTTASCKWPVIANTSK